MIKKPVNAEVYRCTMGGMIAMVRPRVVVEVGAYACDMTKIALQSYKPDHRWYVIDHWKPYEKVDQAQMDKVRAEVMAWAETEPCISIEHGTSQERMETFCDQTIDFVHLDSDKSTPHIRADIIGWGKKVCPGGWLTGDNFEDPRVADAVKELVPDYRLAAKGRIWFAQMP